MSEDDTPRASKSSVNHLLDAVNALEKKIDRATTEIMNQRVEMERRVGEIQTAIAAMPIEVHSTQIQELRESDTRLRENQDKLFEWRDGFWPRIGALFFASVTIATGIASVIVAWVK